MAEVGDVFDDWSRKGRAKQMEKGHMETARDALKAIPIRPGQSFLDLGCGNAWAARSMMDRGAEVMGVDVSPRMIEEARSLAGVGDFDFRVGDMADLKLTDGVVDVIWSMEALYYHPNVDAVLKECLRVLRPGGSIHLLMDYYRENEASHGWPKQVGLRMDLRSEKVWLESLERAGFRKAQAEHLVDPQNPAPWKRWPGTLYLRAAKA